MEAAGGLVNLVLPLLLLQHAIAVHVFTATVQQSLLRLLLLHCPL
jgi:hypothetical protein